jgi:hypothetical protein
MLTGNLQEDLNMPKKTTKKPVTPQKRLTKAEKRVAIAKDVIAQLKAGKYRAETGSYCEIDLEEAALLEPTAELQKELKKVSKCQVCALGSLFVSDVRKFDKLKVSDSGLGAKQSQWECDPEPETFVNEAVDEFAMRDRLGSVFSQEQLALIEAVFEGSDVTGYLDENDLWSESIRDFFYSYAEDAKRMTAIMRNIARNGGTFKLPKASKSESALA